MFISSIEFFYKSEFSLEIPVDPVQDLSQELSRPRRSIYLHLQIMTAGLYLIQRKLLYLTVLQCTVLLDVRIIF